MIVVPLGPTPPGAWTGRAAPPSVEFVAPSVAVELPLLQPARTRAAPSAQCHAFRLRRGLEARAPVSSVKVSVRDTSTLQGRGGAFFVIVTIRLSAIDHALRERPEWFR